MNRFEFYQIFPERNLNFAEFCNKKKRFFGFGVGFLAVSDKFAEFTNFTKFTKIAEFTYFTKFAEFTTFTKFTKIAQFIAFTIQFNHLPI